MGNVSVMCKYLLTPERKVSSFTFNIHLTRFISPELRFSSAVRFSVTPVWTLGSLRDQEMSALGRLSAVRPLFISAHHLGL